MTEKKQISGIITGINNKVYSKGQSYSIFSIITLEGEELCLFMWDNNLKLLNKFAKFEFESNIKDDKQYNTIITMEVKK